MGFRLRRALIASKTTSNDPQPPTGDTAQSNEPDKGQLITKKLHFWSDLQSVQHHSSLLMTMMALPTLRLVPLSSAIVSKLYSSSIASSIHNDTFDMNGGSLPGLETIHTSLPILLNWVVSVETAVLRAFHPHHGSAQHQQWFRDVAVSMANRTLFVGHTSSTEPAVWETMAQSAPGSSKNHPPPRHRRDPPPSTSASSANHSQGPNTDTASFSHLFELVFSIMDARVTELDSTRVDSARVKDTSSRLTPSVTLVIRHYLYFRCALLFPTGSLPQHGVTKTTRPPQQYQEQSRLFDWVLQPRRYHVATSAAASHGAAPTHQPNHARHGNPMRTHGDGTTTQSSSLVALHPLVIIPPFGALTTTPTNIVRLFKDSLHAVPLHDGSDHSASRASTQVGNLTLVEDIESIIFALLLHYFAYLTYLHALIAPHKHQILHLYYWHLFFSSCLVPVTHRYHESVPSDMYCLRFVPAAFKQSVLTSYLHPLIDATKMKTTIEDTAAASSQHGHQRNKSPYLSFFSRIWSSVSDSPAIKLSSRGVYALRQLVQLEKACFGGASLKSSKTVSLSPQITPRRAPKRPVGSSSPAAYDCIAISDSDAETDSESDGNPSHTLTKPQRSLHHVSHPHSDEDTEDTREVIVRPPDLSMPFSHQLSAFCNPLYLSILVGLPDIPLAPLFSPVLPSTGASTNIVHLLSVLEEHLHKFLKKMNTEDSLHFSVAQQSQELVSDSEALTTPTVFSLKRTRNGGILPSEGLNTTPLPFKLSQSGEGEDVSSISSSKHPPRPAPVLPTSEVRPATNPVLELDQERLLPANALVNTPHKTKTRRSIIATAGGAGAAGGAGSAPPAAPPTGKPAGKSRSSLTLTPQESRQQQTLTKWITATPSAPKGTRSHTTAETVPATPRAELRDVSPLAIPLDAEDIHEVQHPSKRMRIQEHALDAPSPTDSRDAHRALAQLSRNVSIDIMSSIPFGDDHYSKQPAAVGGPGSMLLSASVTADIDFGRVATHTPHRDHCHTTTHQHTYTPPTQLSRLRFPTTTKLDLMLPSHSILSGQQSSSVASNVVTSKSPGPSLSLPNSVDHSPTTTQPVCGYVLATGDSNGILSFIARQGSKWSLPASNPKSANDSEDIQFRFASPSGIVGHIIGQAKSRIAAFTESFDSHLLISKQLNTPSTTLPLVSVSPLHRFNLLEPPTGDPPPSSPSPLTISVAALTSQAKSQVEQDAVSFHIPQLLPSPILPVQQHPHSGGLPTQQHQETTRSRCFAASHATSTQGLDPSQRFTVYVVCDGHGPLGASFASLSANHFSSVLFDAFRRTNDMELSIVLSFEQLQKQLLQTSHDVEQLTERLLVKKNETVDQQYRHHDYDDDDDESEVSDVGLASGSDHNSNRSSYVNSRLSLTSHQRRQLRQDRQLYTIDGGTTMSVIVVDLFSTPDSHHPSSIPLRRVYTAHVGDSPARLYLHVPKHSRIRQGSRAMNPLNAFPKSALYKQLHYVFPLVHAQPPTSKTSCGEITAHFETIPLFSTDDHEPLSSHKEWTRLNLLRVSNHAVSLTCSCVGKAKTKASGGTSSPPGPHCRCSCAATLIAFLPSSSLLHQASSPSDLPPSSLWSFTFYDLFHAGSPSTSTPSTAAPCPTRYCSMFPANVVVTRETMLEVQRQSGSHRHVSPQDDKPAPKSTAATLGQNVPPGPCYSSIACINPRPETKQIRPASYLRRSMITSHPVDSIVDMLHFHSKLQPDLNTPQTMSLLTAAVPHNAPPSPPPSIRSPPQATLADIWSTLPPIWRSTLAQPAHLWIFEFFPSIPLWVYCFVISHGITMVAPVYETGDHLEGGSLKLVFTPQQAYKHLDTPEITMENTMVQSMVQSQVDNWMHQVSSTTKSSTKKSSTRKPSASKPGSQPVHPMSGQLRQVLWSIYAFYSLLPSLVTSPEGKPTRYSPSPTLPPIVHTLRVTRSDHSLQTARSRQIVPNVTRSLGHIELAVLTSWINDFCGLRRAHNGPNFIRQGLLTRSHLYESLTHALIVSSSASSLSSLSPRQQPRLVPSPSLSMLVLCGRMMYTIPAVLTAPPVSKANPRLPAISVRKQPEPRRTPTHREFCQIHLHRHSLDSMDDIGSLPFPSFPDDDDNDRLVDSLPPITCTTSTLKTRLSSKPPSKPSHNTNTSPPAEIGRGSTHHLQASSQPWNELETVTQIGAGIEWRPEINSFSYNASLPMTVALFSDGVSEVMTDDEIQSVLATSSMPVRLTNDDSTCHPLITSGMRDDDIPPLTEPSRRTLSQVLYSLCLGGLTVPGGLVSPHLLLCCQAAAQLKPPAHKSMLSVTVLSDAQVAAKLHREETLTALQGCRGCGYHRSSCVCSHDHVQFDLGMGSMYIQDRLNAPHSLTSGQDADTSVAHPTDDSAPAAYSAHISMSEQQPDTLHVASVEPSDRLAALFTDSLKNTVLPNDGLPSATGGPGPHLCCGWLLTDDGGNAIVIQDSLDWTSHLLFSSILSAQTDTAAQQPSAMDGNAALFTIDLQLSFDSDAHPPGFSENIVKLHHTVSITPVLFATGDTLNAALVSSLASARWRQQYSSSDNISTLISTISPL